MFVILLLPLYRLVIEKMCLAAYVYVSVVMSKINILIALDWGQCLNWKHDKNKSHFRCNKIVSALKKCDLNELISSILINYSTKHKQHLFT